MVAVIIQSHFIVHNLYMKFHVQCSMKSGEKKKKKTWNLFPWQMNKQHPNFISMCKHLHFPVLRVSTGCNFLKIQIAHKSVTQEVPQTKINTLLYIQFELSSAWVFFAIGGDFCHIISKLAYQLGLKNWFTISSILWHLTLLYLTGFELRPKICCARTAGCCIWLC